MVSRRLHAALLVALLAFPASSTLAAPPTRCALTLARAGQPASTIVLDRTPTKAAQFAAYELQWHLQQISGATVPIAHDGEPMKGVKLLVGESAATRALKLKSPCFKPQEYLIRFLPTALILMGHDKADTGAVQYNQTPTQAEYDTWPGIWDEQGTMYAVYDFLERYCNVRWLNCSEFGTDIPRQDPLTVTGSEVRRAPFMKYRFAYQNTPDGYDYYTNLWWYEKKEWLALEAAAHPEKHKRFDVAGGYFIAKRGWNQLFRLRHREGGEKCPGSHSLYGYYRRFWEPEKGKEELFEGRHADWFAVSSAGTPGYPGQPPQMCYTNRGLIEQVAKDACEFFETGKVYAGGESAGDYFCIEPMDNDQFCKCANCQRWLDGRDATTPFWTNGRHSDYVFQFVNEVAKIVGKKHPGKRIVTLAYFTHGAPPQKVRLEPNVLVQYCFACQRLTYDRPTYEHEVALLKQWRAEYPVRTLYLWLYYCFPLMMANIGKFQAFPGFFAHSIGEQFDLFHRYGYTGVYHCGYGQEVEAYVTYRLMDDPKLRVDALLDEYFTRLYGPAAGPLREFYETVERTYGSPANYAENIATGKAEGHHHQTAEMAWKYLGTEERMAQLGKLMAQAQARAQTPEQKQRVELFRLGVWEYMVAGRKQYLERPGAAQTP